MDVLTMTHVGFTRWNNVVYDDRGGSSPPHGNADAVAGTPGSYAAGTDIAWDRSGFAVTGICYHFGLLGGIELPELLDGAAQPDVTGRSVG
jgi:hypothetical protein